MIEEVEGEDLPEQCEYVDSDGEQCDGLAEPDSEFCAEHDDTVVKRGN